MIFSKVQQELQVWFQFVKLWARQVADVSEERLVRRAPLLLHKIVEVLLELLEDRVLRPFIVFWPSGPLTLARLAHGVEPRWLRSTRSTEYVYILCSRIYYVYIYVYICVYMYMYK